MTDDLDVHDLRVSDLEDRVAILERKLDGALKNWAAVAKAHSDLADDFTKVEAKSTEHEAAISELFDFKIILNDREANIRVSIVKQRAVNDALKKWADPYAVLSRGEEYRAKEDIYAALCEALK